MKVNNGSEESVGKQDERTKIIIKRDKYLLKDSFSVAALEHALRKNLKNRGDELIGNTDLVKGESLNDQLLIRLWKCYVFIQLLIILWRC